MIKKCKEKDKESGKPWCLYSKDGTKLLGRHKTKEDALAQERAINISKHGRFLKFLKKISHVIRLLSHHGTK